jgi:1-acyl-sn-glycerol-3-phosphate acyltransferase
MSRPARHRPVQASSKWMSAAIDVSVTLVLWVYFTVGFILLFAPFYLFAAIFAANRRRAFQRLNHYFYRGFFMLCRLLAPRHSWRIDPAVGAIRSSVIVCNHASYIDPLLLIAQFAQHTTIVKSRLFRIPIFGWMLRLSGYLPSTTEEGLAELMIRRTQTLAADLAQGANLFVFPEGTRSRTGAIGRFNPGAFKIARLCRAPICVIVIRHTDRLFQPGRFRFNTCCANTISVELLARITPPYDSAAFSINGLMEQVRCLMEKHQDAVDP